MNIAIVVSKFNETITTRLLHGAKKTLTKNKVPKNNIKIFYVPGAFEIPYMCQKIADLKKIDGIIALGVVIKGETDHYKAVCDGVTFGIQKVSVENRLPIMLGVLMCETQEQAMRRSKDAEKYNKGSEAAEGLLELLRMKQDM